jgi:protein O-mannosyl-transferase
LRRLLELPVLASLLFLISLTGLTVHAFRRHSGDVRTRLGLVFMLWFFITVSISSSLIPLPDMKADHRTYLPSIGLLVVVMCLLDWLRTTSSRMRLGVPMAESMVVLAVMALAAGTCLRNEYWRSNVALWEETLKQSPGKFGAWVNLGAAYTESRQHEKAIGCYHRAIALNPNYPGAKINLIHSLASLQRWQECLDVGLPLIESLPNLRDNKVLMYQLSVAMAGLGRLDEAERNLIKLAAASPDDFLTRKVLGMVYACKNQLHQAMFHLKAAHHMNPQDKLTGTLMTEIKARLGGPSTSSDSAGE